MERQARRNENFCTGELDAKETSSKKKQLWEGDLVSHSLDRNESREQVFLA